MKLLLVRHPRTAAADGLCYGRTDLPALRQTTRTVAARVAPRLPADVALTCSPLSRCTALAQVLTELRPGSRVVIDARLAEMDFGAWEAHRWADIDHDELDAWTRGFAHTRAGGGGESTGDFLRRVGSAFDAWRSGGRDAVWITHAGVIRAAWLLNAGSRAVERADQWPNRPIAFGECVTIEGM
jgi:alpha-ribazole phosphatase